MFYIPRIIICTQCLQPSMKRVLLLVFSIILLGAATLASVGAGASLTSQTLPNGLAIPTGFEKVTAVYGAQLYRKDYQGGNPDFVQVVDLSLGAKIELLHGSIKEKREGHGAYGGDDPRILSRSLQQYWDEFTANHANPFCVVNGQFFYMPESPTRLPFPLKVDGQIVSDGFGKQQFPGQKLMLELWRGRADIRQLSKAALYSSTAPNIVAGLAEDARKAINKYVGRTFIGVVDKDGDARYETVLVFTTRSARQVDAAEVLRSFGAQKVMMLDGGGSTQMICMDKSYIASERLIPQALGVQGGVPPSPSNKKAQISSAETSSSAEAEDSPQAKPVQVASEPSEPAQVGASQIALAQPLYDLGNILWVPGMMLPAMAFILLLVLRTRFN